MICTYSETDYALNVLRSERRDRGLSEPVPLSLEIAEKKPEIQLGESFTQMLNRLIEERHMTSSTVYKEADCDRKLFSKIQKQPDYQPKKDTAIRFALALQLSLEETKKLLETAGYVLSGSIKKDCVIRQCIERDLRDVWYVRDKLQSQGLGGL